MEQFPILIRTYAGLEEILAEEVRQMGGAEVKILTRAVECEGDNGFVYKLNLGLRTALRVLRPVKSFSFKTNDDFYNEIFDIEWHKIFDVGKTFIIDTLLFSEKFNNSMFVSQLAKDAIADRFRKEVNKRPFIDSSSPDIYISVYVRGSDVTIYLDSSGASLHMRGYRTQQVKAPLSEVMAAGILKLSGWTHHFPLIDPMCGSGTFSIEAALMANNIPPGIFRSGFSFEHWKDFDKEVFTTILESLNKRITDHPLDIRASDRSRVALQTAISNAKEAGVENDIVFEPSTFEKLPVQERKSFLFMNPPYGERLEEADIEGLYKMIGATLKHSFSGSEAWVFTSNVEALKHVGLHASKKLRLFNGPLECRLLRYDLYAGSKKASKNQG